MSEAISCLPYSLVAFHVNEAFYSVGSREEDSRCPLGRLMTDLEMILCINRENHLQLLRHYILYASSI